MHPGFNRLNTESFEYELGFALSLTVEQFQGTNGTTGKIAFSRFRGFRAFRVFFAVFVFFVFQHQDTSILQRLRNPNPFDSGMATLASGNGSKINKM